MENVLTIKDYFNKGILKIPNYQRGYKWGVPCKDGTCAVSVLTKNLIDAYIRNDNEYFLEAVTVVEKDKHVIIVDGQQRTTTIYLIFAALDYFDILQSINLEYCVRPDSDKYLKKLKENKEVNLEEEDQSQDVFYFNRAIQTIRQHFISNGEQSYFDKRRNNKADGENITIEDFKSFLLEKVQLLYNKVDEAKAILNFVTLNGLKAVMKDEELVKSDILIKSSRIGEKDTKLDKENFWQEWKINEDRGRIAHNWDKWLYWWNDNTVKEYFGTENMHPLYYLLVTYWNINKGENKYGFDFNSFKSKFISDSVQAKLTFEGLRKLQKTFEDYYSTTEIFNYLGIILKTSNNKEDALYYFLQKKDTIQKELAEYSKWSLVGATHLEITQNLLENENGEEILIKYKKAQKAINMISSKYVYMDENDQEIKESKEWAFKFLLLLNLIEDNKLKRRFDFSIWKKRSLEHIFPKSKKGELIFDQDEYKEGSVHCIGNLVLLYGINNSEFGAKTFEDKKKVFFNTGNILDFQSRHLLHTLSVFASPKWTQVEIMENKKNTIEKIEKLYEFK